jgi:hypothetical protein
VHESSAPTFLAGSLYLGHRYSLTGSSSGGWKPQPDLLWTLVDFHDKQLFFLIDTATLALRNFPGSDQRYTILSHTRGPAEDEVIYEDMTLSERSEATLAKPGYAKIINTCEIARENCNLPYAWIDTFRINNVAPAILPYKREGHCCPK